MLHGEWVKLVKAALDDAKLNPTSAAAALVDLADEIEVTSRENVGEYQFEQSLSLAASVLDQVESGAPALVPLERLCRALKAQVLYLSRSLANALASRALILFSIGRPEDARLLVYEAMKMAAIAPYSNYQLEKALTALREYELQRERPVG